MKKANHFGLASSVRTILIAVIGLMASNYATAAFPDSCGVNMLFEKGAWPDNTPNTTSATATFTSSMADQTIEVAVPASVGTDMTNNSLKIVDRNCPVQITSVTVQDDNGSSLLNIWTAYDGTTKDGNVYNFPTGAEDWAGFVNGTPGAGTFRFDSPGKVTIVGKIYNPAGQTAQAASVTVGGAKPAKGENDQEGKTGDSGIIFQYPFGGVYSEGANYTADWRLPKADNPTSGSSIAAWAGWASPMADYDVSTWRFPNGGKIFFTAKRTAGSPKIRFKFEKQNGSAEPAFYTDWIILEEGTKDYLVDLPARPEGESYSNFLLYMYDDGTLVSADITNLGVYGIEPLTDCPATEKFVFDGIFGGSEVQGHKVETGDCDAPPKYVIKQNSQSWAGFVDVNKKSDVYPLYFPNGGKINFKGKGNNKVYFKFEDKPNPNTGAEFFTGKIALNANTAGDYSVNIPRSSQPWGVFLMFIEDNNPGTTDTNGNPVWGEDAEVEVWDVTLEGNETYVPPPIPTPTVPVWGLLALTGLVGFMGLRRRRK